MMRLRILEINTVRNWFIPQVGFLTRKLEIYAKYPIAYIQFFAQCSAEELVSRGSYLAVAKTHNFRLTTAGVYPWFQIKFTI